MLTSEILQEAKADIEDVEHWKKGGWADINGVYSVYDFLDTSVVSQVCAVTSVARVCVRHVLVELQFTETQETDHACNCPNCDTMYDEDEEVARDLDAVMSDFTHEARDLLNAAANELYNADIEHVNDDQKYTHADVMSCYDLAVQKALDSESGEVAS